MTWADDLVAMGREAFEAKGDAIAVRDLHVETRWGVRVSPWGAVTNWHEGDGAERDARAELAHVRAFVRPPGRFGLVRQTVIYGPVEGIE